MIDTQWIIVARTENVGDADAPVMVPAYEVWSTLPTAADVVERDECIAAEIRRVEDAHLIAAAPALWAACQVALASPATTPEIRAILRGAVDLATPRPD